MKKLLLLVALGFSVMMVHAQKNVWTASTSKNVLRSPSTERLSFPTDYKLFNFDELAFRQQLSSAPMRSSSSAQRGVVITLPNVDGRSERFQVFESSNFEPALQAQFPEIRAYIGFGMDDVSAQVRFSVDPKGVQAMIFRTSKRAEFMEPFSIDGSTYAVYNSSMKKGNLPFVCSTEDIAIAQNLKGQAKAANRSSSGELLNFRLAMSCNGEYTQYFGGTVAGALSAINASITRVNGVFETDFAIHMNIVANTTSVIYTNAATDPYTSMGQWNGQLQTTLTQNIGEANYDVGHMFGATGGGGNAGCIGCVCVDGQKGRGITSPADGIPMGDNFDIDYVAHELGHQFGGNHTFSNNVEGSGVNVEPGSGSTIMGYAGITAQDIAQHSDPYFVYASIKQVQDNMVGKACPTRITLNNIAPVMNAGADYTIPKSTPFVLTASAVAQTPATLTYCWEQNDTATNQTGNNSQASPTKTGGPNWRSYNPTLSPSRYFPPLARVVNNQLTSVFGGITIEAVSSVARTLNFVVTGRDNVAGMGQTGTDAMVVTVSGAAGPFLVSSPNTNVSWGAASNQTVTWDVAGTDANGVNAATVDIFLSTDGGLTYPMQLASNVPNDGSETVTMPSTASTMDRIMVKGYDHVFYDISNTNFSVTAPTSTFSIAFSGAGEQNKAACQGADVNYAFNYDTVGGFSAATTFAVSGQPAGVNVTVTPTLSANGTVAVMIMNTNGATPGLYSMTLTATSGSTVKTVPFYFKLFSSSFAIVAPVSPANGAVSQSVSLALNWTADSNATSYDVEVSTNAAFTNLIASATVSTNSYALTGLIEATTYYWRILPKNTSCSGVFSTPSSFQTGQTACASTSSANVPITISASGAPTINSTLIVPAGSGATISDLNITIDVAHTWVSDLTATLISPSGTQVVLVSGACDDQNNISATFDDSGANLVCSGTTPAVSGTIKPVDLLSAFNGQNSEGTWTLRIADAFNQDGGALNSWSIEFCTTVPLAVKQNTFKNYALVPNPNNGRFSVQLQSNESSDIEIVVHDLRGRMIYNKSYRNAPIFNQEIELTNPASGMYLVTVLNGTSKEVSKMIVK